MADGVILTMQVRDNNFAQIRKGLERKAAMLVKKTAMDWEAQAKSIAKQKGVFDTGTLINSIQAEEVGPYHWVIRVNVEYGAYNEYGTVRMPARPFFGPAGVIVRPQFLRALRQVVSP